MKSSLHLTISAFVLVAFNLQGQTTPGWTFRLYAGLTVTGAVNTVYSIEYITDLGQTNNPSAWRCSEFLQLPASPYLWADKSTPDGARWVNSDLWGTAKGTHLPASVASVRGKT